jgi:hypothetical protein
MTVRITVAAIVATTVITTVIITWRQIQRPRLHLLQAIIAIKIPASLDP